MSRTAPRLGPTAPKKLVEDGDICPVCKSSRYLNPNMVFKVNPECYHKMCESCVDRIFSHGPAPCPIAGCRRTLRKARFKKPNFEDIQIEREVDIRRRVASVFNRREDEFDTLLDYNNYLNEVEDITFNLIHKIDLDATEKKLAAYADSNKQSIQANVSRASQETTSFQARQAAEREQERLRREAARRDDEEKKRILEENRRNILNTLATTDGDANRIAKEGQRVALKKSSARRALTDRRPDVVASDPFTAATANGNADGGAFVIKGLKKVVEPEAEKPYDPFGGLSDETQYYVLQDTYQYEDVDKYMSDVQYTAGGYDFGEWYSRALCEAFSGLGVFIGEETSGRDAAAAVPIAMAATAATVVGVEKSADDVF
ncbi:CDK-activating kinase assembly factor [Patellaria atrata CBS 101060]|uniref:RNA polymerase II transcription factor B subunit 3 n=1 Tax=Patellaria atrata CBS 101060 TaxID=1346257 RepID=A0A9P4S7Z7_9PEZI|nr:CDK-activating kinase assembly factor [Patellaria atrata CBS 101060]